MENVYDVAVIGAGHNGLITAAYLAKRGLKVAVFEKKDIVGGAVSTKEIIPGYQFDLGGSAHILIRLTPIVEELELESFGLEYLEVDPLFYSSFLDQSEFFIYRDLERTVDHLESVFPGDGKAYADFIAEWMPFAKIVQETFLNEPSPLSLKRSFDKLEGKSPLSILNTVRQPYGKLVDKYFNSEKLKTQMTWMAAQSGPPPSQAFTSPFILWQPLYHVGGMARPRGGSGMLTQSLARCISHHGGDIEINAGIDSIVKAVDGNFELRGESVYAKAKLVVSGAHLRTTQAIYKSGKLGRPVTDKEIGNGFGAIVRLALSKPIKYRSSSNVDSRVALQLLCENRRQIDAAYAQFKKGLPASEPPLVAMSFSAVDDSLCPPGAEALWLWAQYYPYELQSGNWDDRSAEIEETIIDQFEKYAPGTKDSIVGSLFQHPKWLEDHLGLHRGNVMHLEMNVSQMFFNRPRWGMSSYKTPVEGLFITGASTHPGGGIMGASGRNAANAVLDHLKMN